jgi:large subunit ribosomal protein L32
MAVPKQKKSKSRTGHRRSVHDRITPANVSACPACGAPKLSHRVCLSCGTYRGRQVVQIIER